ncbi:hypothetical protein A3715_08400 [Oleiphilus sp. HI0009]|nr:hypothetical protein A3715_08400 [Oleiphilus sp. HI0009]KZY63075.1 hypothetical protein A3738_02500 [Oleiphilus sp. HI0066]KZY69138.1 hypothetical protein A3739_09600 [Oleiphilus sp. HI0067]MCH2157429.1 hypothetical protein [Oleiphilaceae bacterium]
MVTPATPLLAQQLRKQVRYGLSPDSPALINEWLAIDRCCYQGFYHGVCSTCCIKEQQSYLELQFRCLLEAVLDELVPLQWRCTCLDHIYKPLFNLKKICNDDDSKQRLQTMFSELALMSSYFNASLTGLISQQSAASETDNILENLRK